MELEEAMRRRKDPRSNSQIICCKRCLVGPSEKSTSPKVANTVNLLMIGFNILSICYTLRGEELAWLVSLNIGLGLIAQMLMWCVQCSDPGIINRNQDKAALTYLLEQEQAVLESGESTMNFNDSLLSLSSFEARAVNGGNGGDHQAEQPWLEEQDSE